jgi:two-component system response regulator DesR
MFGAGGPSRVALGEAGLIHALLAMDAGLIRGALAYVLATQDDIQVVAEVDSLAKVLDTIRTECPDVTLADGAMLGVDGLALAREACEETTNSRLLVLVDPRRWGVFRAELANLPERVGLLAENVTPDRVVDGVRRLARGERVLDPELVVAALRSRTALTPREVSVLEIAAQGLPVREIAERLSLSPGTVRNYLSRVIAKTGARTRIEAITIAREEGWL